MVTLDEGKCKQVAEILRKIEVPPANEDDRLPGMEVTNLPNFYLAVVAICHQTSPQGGVQLRGQLADGTEKFGWDYLRSRWAERVVASPSLNTPSGWAQLQLEDVEALFVDELGRSSLTDCAGRASLLRDLGEHFRTAGTKGAADLLIRSESRLESAVPAGLYRRLAEIRAYRDPVRKKSSFFLELMRSQCGWQFVDVENLSAPVDYHEVRGHFRLGTVVIEDPALLNAINAGAEVTPEQDVAIRSAVSKAIRRISELLSRSDVATLHYLFWNLFRRCCGRSEQHCGSCGAACGLPDRYRQAFASVNASACLLNAVCSSAGAEHKLTEHRCVTDYY
jgi:hypothetical protein